jgi:hypothetical protein
MKTNDQLETLIQNLIDRMNRVEVTVANMTIRKSLQDTTSEAIAALDQAIAAQNSYALKLAAIRDEQ